MIRIKNNITPRLPDEYQEVEYIQSTGTQYINTNYKITPNTEIIVDGMIIGNGYFATAGRAGYYMSGIYGNSSTSKICAKWRNGASSNLTIATSEDIGENRHTFKLNKTAFYMDNVNIGDFNSTYNFSATDDIYIFGLGEVSMSVGRLYSMTISDNGVLVRKLIPCYRKSDNEIGLYDLANNVFYINTGTGTFLMGTEVNKPYINLRPIVGSKKLVKRYVGENLIYGEVEPSYKQIINYTMLYDNGNECTALTGGWKVSSKYNNAVATKYTDHIYLHTSTASAVTNNLIDLTQYLKFGGVLKNIVSTTGQARFAIGKANTATDGTSLGWNDIAGNKVYNLTKSYSHFVGLYNLPKSESYYLATMVTDAKNNAYGSVYNMFLLKQDDWQTLCTKTGLNPSNYTDEAALCGNSTAIAEILSNESAVKYMIYNCTGSFMGEFIANDDCLTALNNSPYKTLIQANEHWNKFLNMVA